MLSPQGYALEVMGARDEGDVEKTMPMPPLDVGGDIEVAGKLGHGFISIDEL
jgi:hypothetical protein